MVESSPQLLKSPCKVPPKTSDVTITMQTKHDNAKRRFSDPATQSCDSLGNKKICRWNSWELRPSRVRWKLPVHREEGVDVDVDVDVDVSLSANESMGRNEDTDTELSTNNARDIWYTIMLDQCLTVQIMRSLRILAKKQGAAVDDEVENGENNNGKSGCEELMKKLAIDPNEYCERGLESYRTDEARKKINEDRKNHKLSVINEYKRQGMTGTKDPELLRSVSIAESKRSCIKAQRLASIDQQEALASRSATKEPQAQHQQLKQNPLQLNSLGSQRDSLGPKQPNYTLQGTTNPITQPVHRSDTHFVQNARSDECFKHHQNQRYHDVFVKQEYRNLLLTQQQQQQQHAQSQLRYHHPQAHKNELMNIQQNPSCTSAAAAETPIMLAAFQEQQLFRRNHQLCYQENVRQLLHHRQQEQLRVVGLVSAALVDHSPR
eukprot:jgi/Psemu1/31180/gm1.31180_g